MSAVGAKWAVRRYQPAEFYSATEQPLTPQGHKEELFDDWRDVCTAMDTIIGANCLQMGVRPTDPVVIQHGEDVILIYMKLEV